MSVLDRLLALDAALVSKGWPPLSPWWQYTLTRFVESNRRQLVLRVGRRGGKSSSLVRFAVAFALSFDVSQIPPGDVGVIAFISTRQDEASQRLRTIKSALDAINVRWRPIDGGVELVGRPIAFKVFPASIAGVSGFTAILVVADEVSKWRDAESGANPATDVLAAVRPTMATQSAARMILSSSPLTNDDAHARAFDAGDTDHQITALATSWEANPTITEEQTRRDEPDARVWAREYAAIPQSSVLGAFDGDAVKRAFCHPRHNGLARRAHLIIDASSGRVDRFTAAIVKWVTPRKDDTWTPYLHFAHVQAVGEGSFWKEKGAGVIADDLARLAREWNVATVHGDQREAYTWKELLGDRGLTFYKWDWTGASKPRAVERVRRWFAEGTIALEPHPILERELLAFEERATASGSFTYGARGSGHDDFVALLLTAALAELDGPLSQGGNDPERNRLIIIDRSDRNIGPRRRDPYLLSLIRARHNQP